MVRSLGPIPLILTAGAVSTAIVSATLTGGLAGFTATISKATGSGAAASLGTIVLKETATDGTSCVSATASTVATNSATCTSINEFAGAALLTPNDTWSATTVTLTNTGTAAASSLQVAPGSCTSSGGGTGSATDVCSALQLRVTATPASGTPTQLYSGALNAMGTQALGALAAQGTTTVRFEVRLPAAVASPNTYQGLSATMPLTWTLSS